ncbi:MULTISPECIES: hypothetical protein [unclassified Chamaesiphon]|uniref:hypothetical protein n=1 Tax=unclassified Chamaesiphon TaxID=2620921 RepID=UPI00286A8511|nr:MULTISPECIES: hypothetical protein [unclassified Chamaesiphon]
MISTTKHPLNALVHADDRGIGGTIVETYGDRFELSNPGSLLVSRDRLWAGNINRLIANI